MRKTIALLLLLLLIPTAAHASSYGNMYYVPYLDQYRLDYAYNSNDVRYDLYFVASDGLTYTATYNQTPTGIHYLTCNGTYEMRFYDSAGQIIHTLGPIVTTAIVQPSCESYADGVSGADDLGAHVTTIGDGYRLGWQSPPGATSYQIWRDGQLVGTTPGNSYDTTKGSVSVVALNQDGQIVGRSDIIVPKANSDCCQALSELLSCPDWDIYMSEVSKAVHNGLPTLPEWRQIADQFTLSLSDYIGPVPAAPTLQQIDSQVTTTLPPLDTAVPSVAPTVPDDYNNGPLPFDVTTGPQIDVTDQSEPFDIYEPDAYNDADAVGKMVYPGDPANSSSGIKEPDKLTTPYMVPTPITSSSPSPPETLPLPSVGVSSMPTPNNAGGVIPIPQ